jgi:hypothetical protein
VAPLRVLHVALFPFAALGFGPWLLPGRSREILRFSLSSEGAATAAEKTVTLNKPLGLILEEVQEGKAAGVFVKEVSDSGSAFAIAGELQGMMVAKVMGTECSSMDFDSVMDLIRNTESNEVTVSFTPRISGTGVQGRYAEGTTVTIRVKQASKPDLVFDAKVGENLRQALIANGFEVYQGMQKLGNCGYVWHLPCWNNNSNIDFIVSAVLDNVDFAP